MSINITDIIYFNNAANFKRDEAPEGHTLIKLPFVGIYQSQLEGEIDSSVECSKEYLEDEQDASYADGRMVVSIDYEGLFARFANETAELLGIKGKYAGYTVPQFFNYDDACIYYIVTNEHLAELYARVNLTPNDKWYHFDLMIALTNAAEELYGKPVEDTYDGVSSVIYDYLEDNKINVGDYITYYSTQEWNEKKSKESEEK